MIAFADDAEMLDVEAALREFAHRIFGLDVIDECGDDGIILGHSGFLLGGDQGVVIGIEEWLLASTQGALEAFFRCCLGDDP